MDSSHKEILHKLEKSIISDVDVYNGIIHPLVSEYILKDQDIAEIQKGASKSERAKILLDLLPSCGPTAFEAFHQSLRHHYGWISDDIDKMIEANSTTTNETSDYGGCPNLPPVSPLTVTRDQKLRDALCNLKPKEYVVLRGMKGFGKSSLTASTLKDTKLVKNLFQNKVYWIKFGYDRSIEQEIIIQLNALYHHIRNLEIVPETLKVEPLQDSLVLSLKHHFSKVENCNALLILDDVCRKEIIDIFDFKCKTLVITTDISILGDRNRTVIEINDGFTETETLGLFAKVLNTSPDKLPKEAKKLHKECKGMPLLIAMFAAQFEEFKEDMKRSSARWEYYLQCLIKKDAKNKVIKKFLEKQSAIFDMCIKELPTEIRECYEELAIFNEDVNIMPKTLEILWGGHPYEVEEKMLDLCHKSLAAKQWNSGLKTYIYGVHDLLLCHLREKLGKKKLVQIHKSFVEKYETYCEGDFSKLPKDNYIHSYIGHHLEQAGLIDKFPNLYLNFDFLQAKINCTGLSDLVIDLKKYRRFITNNNKEYERKVTELEHFLQEQASVIAEHRHKKCLDLVQIGLNYRYPGYITETALKIAHEKPNYLYFSHDRRIGEIIFPLTEEISNEICTSSFTDNHNSILIGTKTGQVIEWDSITKKNKFYRSNNEGCIKKIVLSENGEYFLSLNSVGIIKLFNLHDDEGVDDHETYLRSPSEKQFNWTGIFTNNESHDDSSLTLTIDNEIILDVIFGYDDECIAACTNKGSIWIWNLEGKTITFHKNKQGGLKNIAFTSRGHLLHVMDDIHGVLITYGRPRDQKCFDDKIIAKTEYKYISQYNPRFQGKNIIFFRDLPKEDNSLIIITEKKAIHIKWFTMQGDLIHNYNKKECASVENAKVFTCATITYDGRYLILADSGGFINVWRVFEGFEPIATYKSHVTSLDTYWRRNKDHHIICGSKDRLIHRWCLPQEASVESVRKPLIDAIIQIYGKTDIIAKETFTNTIEILHNDKTIFESEPLEGKILRLSLSADGTKVIIITDKSYVFLLEVDTKKMIKILTLQDPSDFVEFLNIEDKDIVICRKDENNLKVCHFRVTFSIPNTGYVTAIYAINKRIVITLTKNGVITLWTVEKNYWDPIKQSAIAEDCNMHILNTCLNFDKKFLSVITESQEVFSFDLIEIASSMSNTDINIFYKHQFCNKISCCDITQNGQYLAAGFENGEILIVDIPNKYELHRIHSHTVPIIKLYWAPLNTGTPILLSADYDGLLWLNFALINATKRNRRSRMGFLRNSMSTPSFKTNENESTIVNSKSVSSKLSDLQLQSSVDDVQNNYDGLSIADPNISIYWKGKQAKYHENVALLAVVQLPQSYIAKVFISEDFSKFVTVDIHGSVNSFSPFGLNER
ncbi:apoptotic protease-activating factor 1 isoform X2 [Prorops nasuta]|uniref:apoptotic protease-activating factor 1 isoform X2 n=1 Tax=Prorops nasuta TaxID=863751 RepID=UPI0034CEF0A2